MEKEDLDKDLSDNPRGNAPRKRTRSRRGCMTCRIRKVKCDENIPECQNCLRTSRKCEGPGSGIFPSRRNKCEPYGRHLSFAPGAYPNNQTASSPEEFRASEYYSTVVVGIIGAGFDLDFWSTQVISQAHQDRAIWYSLLAISTLSEHGNSDNKLPCDRFDVERNNVTDSTLLTAAVRWYDQALKHAGLCKYSSESLPSTNEETTKGVLHCVLSLVIELQLGNARNALRLSDIAFHLLAQVEQVEVTNPNLFSLVPILLRFSAALSMYGYRLPDVSRKVAASCRIRICKDTGKSMLLLLRDQLFDCLYNAQCLMQESSDRYSADQTKKRTQMIQKLAAWQQEFDRCCQQINSSDVIENAQSVLILTLRVISKSLRIELHCYFDETSMLYDGYADDFASVLDDIESILVLEETTPQPSKFSFEFGYLPCILFVAWQCRQKDLRQRALDLALRSRVQQSFWTPAGVYEVVAAVAKLEHTNGAAEGIGPAREASVEVTRFRASSRIGLDGDAPEVDAGEYSILFRHRSHSAGALQYRRK